MPNYLATLAEYHQFIGQLLRKPSAYMRLTDEPPKPPSLPALGHGIIRKQSEKPRDDALARHMGGKEAC
jgi:hypothetical protein